MVGSIGANGKRLGFCGVYAQETFHAIEPNRCYTKKFFNSEMRGKAELNNNNMENLKDLKKKLEKVEK